jgi:hypothetical protein
MSDCTAAIARWRYEIQRYRNDERGPAKALNTVIRAHGPPQTHIGDADAAFEVGQSFRDRMELACAGAHRHFLANFGFTAEGGVESIVLDGDDVLDEGLTFTLTPRIDPAAPDGTSERLQQALHTNVWLQRPIRALRSTALQSSFAPEAGFRYDGLYHPQWSGDRSRWLFFRCPDQPPLGQAPAESSDLDARAALAPYVPPTKRVRVSTPNETQMGPPPEPRQLATAPELAPSAPVLRTAAKPVEQTERCQSSASLIHGSAIPQPSAATPSVLEGKSAAELMEIRAALLLSLDPMTVYRCLTSLALEQGRTRTAIEILHEVAGDAPPMAQDCQEPWPQRS